MSQVSTGHTTPKPLGGIDMTQRMIPPDDQGLRLPRELRARYADLFPSCLDCGDLADGLDKRCWKCASDREWQARREGHR